MKIAIAGFGVEGKSSFNYWKNMGDEVVVVDEKLSSYDIPYGAASILDDNAFSYLDEFDVVVRSPSINPKRLKTKGKIWSATNEFFDKCPAPIIGVTGTKGKGTTSSLIASILMAAGKKVHLVGNIGVPALDLLKDISSTDIVVFELSSFQLWDIQKSPQIAVVLGIEPDHLDVHKSFKEYIEAKANIRRFQTAGDYCTYHPTNKYSKQIAYSAKHVDEAVRYAVLDDGQVYAKDGYFNVRDQRICSVDALQLPGAHNIENACAAISAVHRFGIDNKAVEQGLTNFKGLNHRLKFVTKIDEVSYYDDSIATTPGSAIAALRSFHEQKIIILGGHAKGADYSELIDECAKSKATVIAIGKNGDEIAKLCKKKNVDFERVNGGMAEIVSVATQHASRTPSVVILSPAAASFDMFKSYSDRGDQFIDAVNALGA